MDQTKSNIFQFSKKRRGEQTKKTSMEWKLLHSTMGSADLINKTQMRHGAYLKITMITYPCLLSEAHAVNVLGI